MRIFNKVTLLLLVIGRLNRGLVGLAGFDLACSQHPASAGCLAWGRQTCGIIATDEVA